VSEASRVLLYALVAAASPVALASALVAIGSGRVKGAAFGIGFVLGQSAVLAIALAFGSITGLDETSGRGTLADVLELILGALLLAAARLARRGPPARERTTSPRMEALLQRLARVKPASAFSLGALLGVGGPKRLTITLLTAATITLAQIPSDDEVVLAVLYVAVATTLVWAPVCASLVLGERADEWMTRAQAALLADQAKVAFVALLVLGSFLLLDGLVRLL
jgi:hypothetical protein